jgi:hypothetical protein
MELNRFMWFHALPSRQPSRTTLYNKNDGIGFDSWERMGVSDVLLSDIAVADDTDNFEGTGHAQPIGADAGLETDDERIGDDDDDDDEEVSNGDDEDDDDNDDDRSVGKLRGRSSGTADGGATETRSVRAAPVKRLPLLQYFASTGNRAVNIEPSGSFKYVFVKVTDLEDKSALVVQGCPTGGELS